MGTNVPEEHTASIFRAEVSKYEKLAGDTKGRRKEKGNGGITTINQKKRRRGPNRHMGTVGPVNGK